MTRQEQLDKIVTKVSNEKTARTQTLLEFAALKKVKPLIQSERLERIERILGIQ